jgi:2-methylisocitrate lyase-like PEP mutase family enzyme
LKRLKNCIEFGGEVAFLEGPTTLEQCKQVCKSLAPTPVLLNMVPGGVTPQMTVQEAKEIGFRIMIHPGLALSAVIKSVTAALKELKSTGMVALTEEDLKSGVKSIFTVCGLIECMEFDKAAGGTSYTNGV